MSKNTKFVLLLSERDNNLDIKYLSNFKKFVSDQIIKAVKDAIKGTTRNINELAINSNNNTNNTGTTREITTDLFVSDGK